jgi:hypothetical protein
MAFTGSSGGIVVGVGVGAAVGGAGDAVAGALAAKVPVGSTGTGVSVDAGFVGNGETVAGLGPTVAVFRPCVAVTAAVGTPGVQAVAITIMHSSNRNPRILFFISQLYHVLTFFCFL